MERILIAIDGSELSLRGIDAVNRLISSGLSAQVRLLHVSEPLYNVPEFATSMVIEQYEDTREDLQKQILETAQVAARRAGIESTTEGRSGFAADEILEACKDYDATMIVMGTQGLGAIASLFLGSVAQQVIHKAKVPVFAVR